MHRLYQNTVELTEPGLRLETEYREALAKEKTNPDLMYLTGRVVSDPAEARSLFAQAAAASNPCPYALFALAYDEVALASFPKGLELIDKALALKPGDGSFVQIEKDALSGMGNVERLLQINAEERRVSPLDSDLLAEQILLLVRKGEDGEPVKRAIEESIKRLGRSAKPGEIQAWRDYLEAMAAYARGDQAGYGVKLAKIPGDLNAFQSAFCLGKYHDAAKVLDHSKDSVEMLRLLIYIAAQRLGETSFAEQQFQAALAEIEKSGRHGKKIADCLKGPDAPSANEAKELIAPVSQKRIILTALGVRYEKIQEPCFHLAAQLNSDTQFPYLFLNSVVGSGPADLASGERRSR
jgi:tetratricopeptide (TPR) repeat protein